MSWGNQRSSEILDDPHHNIGAQDLLKLDISHSGFLRRRGRLERIVGRLRPLSIILPALAKWRQRYVILSRGCLYVYSDEFSSNPQVAVSLQNYSKVERFDLKKEEEEPEEIRKRSFIVEPVDPEINKTLIFACAKDHERREWMNKIKDEMLRANGMNSNIRVLSGDDYGDYAYLETNVKPKIVKPPKPEKDRRLSDSQVMSVKTNPLPKTPGESDSDSDAGDYDEISEANMMKQKGNARRSLPGSKGTKKTELQKPVPTTSPEDEYMFNDSDRKKAEDTLGRGKDGTFLVRNSRQGDQKVLSVKTQEGMKEYKIFTKGSEMSIDNAKFFKDIHTMISYYKKNDLPHRSMTLTRGFRLPR